MKSAKKPTNDKSKASRVNKDGRSKRSGGNSCTHKKGVADARRYPGLFLIRFRTVEAEFAIDKRDLLEEGGRLLADELTLPKRGVS